MMEQLFMEFQKGLICFMEKYMMVLGNGDNFFHVPVASTMMLQNSGNHNHSKRLKEKLDLDKSLNCPPVGG